MQWKKKHTEKVKAILAACMEMMAAEKGDPAVRDWIGFDAATYALNSLVQVPEVRSDTQKYAMIREACRGLTTCKRRDIWTFRRVLAARVRRYLRLTERLYRLVFPLNVEPKSLAHKRWLTVHDLRFCVRSWQYVANHLMVDKWYEEARDRQIIDRVTLHQSFMPLEVSVSARDRQDAFNEAYTAFELMRAVLNLEAFRTYTYQLGMAKPLGKVLAPPVYGVFKEDGDYKTLYWEEVPHRKYERHGLKRATVDQAVRLLAEFGPQREPRATIGIIEDAIRHYSIAVGTADWREAFLRLWQVLEVLTFGPDRKHYNMKVFCRRVRVLLDKDPLLVDLFHACRKARNALVHQGRFADDGQREVRMVKLIAQRCISAVYGLRKTCPDWDSVVIYYKNAATKAKCLQERARVISAIQRMRS